MLILINRRSTPSTCPRITRRLSASMSLSSCLPVCLTDCCNLIKEACGGSRGFAPRHTHTHARCLSDSLSLCDDDDKPYQGVSRGFPPCSFSLPLSWEADDKMLKLCHFSHWWQRGWLEKKKKGKAEIILSPVGTTRIFKCIFFQKPISWTLWFFSAV